FANGRALDVVVFGLVDASSSHDVVITYADRTGVLYRDRLAGKYEAMPIEQLRPGARGLLAQDLDADGSIDLVAGGTSGLTILLNRGGDRFEAAGTPTAAAPPPTRALALADFENRGLTDIVAKGLVLRNGALGRFPAPGSSARASVLANAIAMVTADFDGDGRVDAAAIAADGSLHLLRNETRTKNRWVRIALTGVKNPKLAPQAHVEVKVGARYQKQTYDGVQLAFGIRDATEIDTVRITWPNGLIQNEMNQPVGRALVYKEAPRLSGSCPMIFTWNGRGFQFITDVLGVAPLGASSGDGTYFPVDHDEYVQIPSGGMAVRNGAYEIRITEELREVSYLDQVQLIAADHPAAIDLFTNDKFKSPPFPEFRLFGAERRVHAAAARDGRGADVRAALAARGRPHPAGFKRGYAGVPERHTPDLRSRPDARRHLP